MLWYQDRTNVIRDCMTLKHSCKRGGSENIACDCSLTCQMSWANFLSSCHNEKRSNSVLVNLKVITAIAVSGWLIHAQMVVCVSICELNCAKILSEVWLWAELILLSAWMCMTIERFAWSVMNKCTLTFVHPFVVKNEWRDMFTLSLACGCAGCLFSNCVLFEFPDFDSGTGFGFLNPNSGVIRCR